MDVAEHLKRERESLRHQLDESKAELVAAKQKLLVIEVEMRAMLHNSEMIKTCLKATDMSAERLRGLWATAQQP